MIVTVRLTPRAACERVDAAELSDAGQWLLKARVRAVPEDGRANAALLKLLADSLNLPRSAVILAGGGKSREKRIRLEGEASAIHDALVGLAAPGPGARR